ncbi:MAG: hypothetical protein JSS83_16405 [Cyanobacteria bacterium SZAS LIN-3]|nr:hypothetical protein [Cyanobacteria bacterium SZAS LIN-3]
MKRTLWALCAVLALGFIGLAPSQASAAVKCNTVTVSGSAWPQNRLWICADPTAAPPNNQVTAADITSATQALQKLGSGSISTASNAKTQLNTSDHNFFVFLSKSDFATYCLQGASANLPAPTPLPCPTITPTDYGTSFPTGSVWSSITWANDVHAALGETIGNTMAHEAGHQLDTVYGFSVYGSGRISQEPREYAIRMTGATLTLTGSVTAGDTLTLNITGQFTSGSNAYTTIPLTHPVVAGDSLANIATDFKNQINTNSTFLNSAYNVNATATGASLVISSKAVITYSKTTVGTAGHAATEVLTLSDYDFPHFITQTPPQPQCSPSAGVFATYIDVNGLYFCGNYQDVTTTGTVHNNDTITLRITNVVLSGGFKDYSWTVPATGTFTTTDVATNLKNLISADTATLGPWRITVTSTSNVLHFSDGTGVSTFSMTTTGSETFNIGVLGKGKGNSLNKIGYPDYMIDHNELVLRQGWPHYFLTHTNNCGASANCWSELFAEQTALIAGQIVGTPQTQDDFMQSGNFSCTRNIVQSLEKNGVMPSPTSFPYSTMCK